MAVGPALAQQAEQAPAPPPAGAPKSLLPDDIADPAPTAPGQPESVPSPLGPGAPTALPGFAPVAPPAAEPLALPEPEPVDPLAELAGPTLAPEAAGLLDLRTGGEARDLFAGSDARFLATLLDRMDGPLASRWAQILLQRALLSSAQAPANMNPADWVAARARALVALGSAADAHRLVSRIAIDRYTVPLYNAALLAAVAAGDPMALCPLSPLARLLTESPSWDLADAMCLSILGDEVGASARFDGLRRREEITPFDIGLAERVASATGGGRRGANPEWDEAGSGLTAWRLGLASAAGLEIPAELLGRATPAQKGWQVRLPGLPVAARAALAAEVAATGALSAAEANRLFATEAEALEGPAAADSPGGRLRTAQVAADTADRLRAMKALWSEAPEGSARAYGFQVATAPAAARIAPAPALAADAPALVESLLAAGLSPVAERWWPALSGAEADSRAAVWALLAPVAPSVPLDSGLFDRWAGSASAHRAALLAAGLEGLGRGRVGPETTALDNDWTRALDRAVAARRPGEVLLIAATGLRGQWADIPPDYLRRIARALSATGHAATARLIVAEAATRG
jgi:hypothetical protein